MKISIEKTVVDFCTQVDNDPLIDSNKKTSFLENIKVVKRGAQLKIVGCFSLLEKIRYAIGCFFRYYHVPTAKEIFDGFSENSSSKNFWSVLFSDSMDDSLVSDNQKEVIQFLNTCKRLSEIGTSVLPFLGNKKKQKEMLIRNNTYYQEIVNAFRKQYVNHDIRITRKVDETLSKEDVRHPGELSRLETALKQERSSEVDPTCVQKQITELTSRPEEPPLSEEQKKEKTTIKIQAMSKRYLTKKRLHPIFKNKQQKKSSTGTKDASDSLFTQSSLPKKIDEIISQKQVIEKVSQLKKNSKEAVRAKGGCTPVYLPEDTPELVFKNIKKNCGINDEQADITSAINRMNTAQKVKDIVDKYKLGHLVVPEMKRYENFLIETRLPIDITYLHNVELYVTQSDLFDDAVREMVQFSADGSIGDLVDPSNHKYIGYAHIPCIPGTPDDPGIPENEKTFIRYDNIPLYLAETQNGKKEN